MDSKSVLVDTKESQLRGDAYQRELLLVATAEAAQRLLRADDLIAALPEALGLLGEAAKMDRLLLLIETTNPSGEPVHQVTAEWTASGVPSHRELGLKDLRNVDFPQLVAKLWAGESFWLHLEDVVGEGQEVFRRLGIITTTGYPIFIEGKYLGLLAFDDCRQRRPFNLLESETLRVIAALIGSALHRHRLVDTIAIESQAAAEQIRLASQTIVDRLSSAEGSRGAILQTLIAAGEVLASLGVVVVGFVAYDAKTNSVRCKLAVRDGSELSIPGTPLDRDWPVDQPPMALPWARVQTEEFIWGLTSDPTTLVPEVRSFHEAHGTRAIAYQPLHRGDKTLGWVAFSLRSEVRPTPEQGRFIQNLAGHIAVAVEMERLAESNHNAAIALERESAARARVAELARSNAALSRSVAAVAQSSDFDHALRAIFSEINTAASADTGFLFEYREQSNTLATLLWMDEEGHGVGPCPHAPPILQAEFNADITPAFRSYVAAQDIMLVNLAEITPEMHELAWPGVLEWHAAHGRQSACAIPILIGKRPLGILGFGWREKASFSTEERELLFSLTHQIAMIVELKRLADSQRQVAVAQEREKATRERAEELVRANHALQATIDALPSIGDLEQFVPTVLRIVAKAFGSINCSYFEHFEGEPIRLRYWYRRGMVLRPAQIEKLNDERLALVQELARGFMIPDHQLGTPVRLRTRAVVLDHRKGTAVDRFDRFCCENGWDVELNVPLVVGGEADGSFLVYRGPGSSFSPNEIALAETLGKQLAVAMRMSRLAQQAREVAVAREREMAAEERAVDLARANEALRRAIDRLARQPSLPAFLGFLLFEIAQQLGCDTAAFTIYDQATNAFQAVAIYHDGVVTDPGPMPVSLRIPDVRFMDRLLKADGFALFDVDADASLFWPGAADWLRQRGRRVSLSFPILVDGRLYGQISLAYPTKPKFSLGQKELVQGLSTQAALAIELTRLAEEAKQTALAREREHIVAQERERASREREEMIQERARELTRANDTLQRTTDALASTQKIEEIVPSLLRILARSLDSPSAAYYEVEGPDTIYLRYYLNEGKVISAAELLAGAGAPPYDLPRRLAQGFRISSAYVGASASKNVATRVINHRAGTSEKEFDEWRRVHDREMELNIPLSSGGEAFGALTISRTSDRPYTREEIELAETLSKQLSLALRAYRLAADSESNAIAVAVANEREQTAVSRADELSRANEKITSSFRELAAQSGGLTAHSIFLVEIAKAASAELCYWLDYSAATDSLSVSLRCREGIICPDPEVGEPDLLRAPLAASLMGDFLRSPASPELTLLSVERDADKLWPGTLEWHKKAGRKQFLCFPLFIGDSLMGMLGMAFREEVEWSASRRELIRALANHLSLSVHLSKLSVQASRGAAMEERARLAREIHDTLGQSFSGIVVQLRAMQRSEAAADSIRNNHFDNALELANSGLAEVRRSLAALRPKELDGRSFREALNLIASAAEKRGGIQVQVVAECNIEVASEEEPELLRIAQESVANAIKHSGASSITIVLRQGKENVELCVEDNGKGFDAMKPTDGFGMMGMQERAARIGATIRIHSGAEGTSVCVEFNGRGNHGPA